MTTSQYRSLWSRFAGMRARRSPAAVSPLLSAQSELARSGPAPLSPRRASSDAPLRVATVVPSFRHGSGGHTTIVNLMRELRVNGHEVTLWLEDCEGRHAAEPAAVTQRSFESFFGAEGLALNTDFASWRGADVVLATGWQTVARALLLPNVAARAYLVQDHEPDFYGASAERLFAEQTYRQGLHCIAASRWLAQLLRDRYGASASHFDLGVDHAVYRPADEPRRDDLVVFYARAVTARRAVPLGLLALDELARRRPALAISLFGEDRALDASFPHTNLGILSPAELAALYRRATVGMVFSLTNPSLICLEMMACGLPCVELATDAMQASFASGAPQLVEPSSVALTAAMELLLEKPAMRSAVSEAGIELTAERTWRDAGRQIESSLRLAVTRDRQ